MNEKPNKIELTYHEAFEKSLDFAKKNPDCLPVELRLEMGGLWMFRVMSSARKHDRGLSGLIYEFMLNP